ncbi:DnaJ domain-containing protein [Coccidioides immitis RS]|uniref:DnaJ domain-containing protein n=4 Tax=Coccidioides immitis TaxID=5501 RepID=J3KEV2_COCIM|nr:DnaJ domain-containing protein [Coccidioides immitis RS]EAS34060.3 DnaJ domain-containing protein [Coccidioides immitis RS]KMP05279.1 DnaJ domain containing protein [Coccidioides immitis RMSCC 2394]KMU77811.1 DnaJ domain -containing protein [Coccidioides immitis RMSCC 3703]KMU85739.1 DnaJ domain-containing protein [Coccidioides immitis H538.4]
MPTADDDLVAGEPPSSINPYEVLGVEEKATADQIKSAYRKQALRHHPDKASPESKDEANKKFQEIAFAYAILSDERRRRRYDTTGNTSESLDLEDDDFDWVDFYREQFSSMVDGKAIEKIKAEYQGSEEEERDLLEAYETYEGDLDKVYEEVMLSNVLDDDERFRKIIKKAIRKGEVTDWPAFSKESAKKRSQRVKAAEKEAREAMEIAKELGVEDKLFGKKKGKGDDDENSLMALIQQRQRSRASNFLADLEAKYVAPSKSGKGKKRRTEEAEPPEEAFQRNRPRTTKKQKAY